PLIQLPRSLAPGSLVAWAPVFGAAGYQTVLTANQTGVRQWESFSQANNVLLPALAQPLSGSYRIEVFAWDQPGLSTRTVASVDSRALRLLPRAGSYRRSSARVGLSF